MDAARKLNVSLLTVSPVSHSISQNGVLSLGLFPLLTSSLLTWLWYVGRCRIVALPCLSTKQVSRVTFASYVVELATIVVAVAVSLL